MSPTPNPLLKVCLLRVENVFNAELFKIKKEFVEKFHMTKVTEFCEILRNFLKVVYKILFNFAKFWPLSNSIQKHEIYEISCMRNFINTLIGRRARLFGIEEER